MKHTYKSLRITAVLSLPTVFGANDTVISNLLEAKPSQGAEAHTYSQVETLAIETRTPDQNFDTAQSTTDALERLGSSKSDTNKRLRKIPSALLYSIRRLPLDSLQMITGCLNKDEQKTLALGFLDLHTIAVLARTSKSFHRTGQPVLNRVKSVRQSVVSTLLTSTPLPPQENNFALLCGARPLLSFDDILNVIFAVKYWTVSMSANEHTALVAAINQNATLTLPQKTILKGLLPNAIPTEIQEAVFYLVNLEPNYFERAAELCELSATHPQATLDDILAAANNLIDLGSAYYDRAAALYEQSANHKDATLDIIRLAANELIDLGSEYLPRAIKLYEKLTTLTGTTPNDLYYKALGLIGLGTIHPEGSDQRAKYHDQAADLLRQSADLKNRATLNDIQNAAYESRQLAAIYTNKSHKHAQYLDMAAALYEQLANHKDATSGGDVRLAAGRLRDLGAEYHGRADALLKKLESSQQTFCS